MKDYTFRIVKRVIERQYNSGENLDDILLKYNNLTSEQKDIIRNELIPQEVISGEYPEPPIIAEEDAWLFMPPSSTQK